LGAAGAALLLRLALTRLVGPGLPTFITFYPAVILVALTAGVGPGLAATLAAALAADYWIIPPLGLLRFPSLMEGVGLVFFTAMGVIFSVVAGLYRRFRDHLEQLVAARTAEKERANEQLRQEIADRKRAGEALRESEERLKRSQEIAHLGSWDLDLVHNRLTWSDEVYRIFGLQPQEFGATYEAFLERVHPDDRAAVDAAYSGSLRENQGTYEIEHRVVRKDTGDIRVVHEKCEHFRDVTGKIIRSVGMVHDITERKWTEEILRRSEERYRSSIELTEQLGWTTNADGEIVEDIPSWRKFTGQREEEVKGWGWSKALHPDDRERIVLIWRNAVATKTNYEVEYRIRRHDGVYRLFLVRGVPVFKGDGNIQEWVGTCIDITERKQAEEALRKSEEALRKSRDELEIRVKQRTAELAKANELLEGMFSSIDISIAYMDKDFNFIRVNRAYAEADEQEPEFFVGKNHFVLFPNEENEQIFRKVADTGEPYSVYGKPFEYTEHPERGVTYWDWSLQPVKEPDGSIGGVVLSLVNVTNRIRAEESAHQQAALLELAHDAIIVRDMQDNILFLNRGAEEMYGWRKDEALGAAIHDLLQTQFPILLDEIKMELIRKGYWEGELVHTRGDGKKILVECRWALRPGKEGHPTAILEINRDITERKRAQEAVEAERQRFNDVLEILPAYLVLLTPDYHVPFANRFFRERFGESHGRHCFEYLFGRSEPCETCESYTALKTMAPHKWEWTGPDGRNYDVFDFPFTDTDGSTLILEMGIDITERKQAQEALNTASLYTRSLIEASLDPLVTISTDGKIMDVNKATELVTGVSRERLIETDFSNYFTEPEKAREGYEEVFSKGSVRDYPLSIRHTSGKVTDVLYHATVYRNEAEEIQGVFAAARDITERKRMEEALRKSENRLRVLSSQLLTVQEAERKRIAREMHDSIGQTLAAIKFGLESKLSQMGGGIAPPGVSIENIISLAQNGIEESRRIQMDLRPSILDDLGILVTIGWFTREFQKVYSHIYIEKEIQIEENDIPAALKTSLFRIMQEAMNNIAKHSKADLVCLSLRKIEGRIELTIEDNGAGFDPETIKQGLGLTSMRERTELSGGTFEVESTPGTGTIIKASWTL
jgi:PAS domain S-box-containing protein